MLMSLLVRKETHFVLWRPQVTMPAPQLIIGIFTPGQPPTLAHQQRLALQPSPLGADLWELPADACQLTAGTVYHYWFEVGDTNPYIGVGSRIWCTDPTAYTVDWRLMAPLLAPPYGADDQDPAAVVLYRGGRLVPCDPGGETVAWDADTPLARLPPNNRLVIYELPTSWARNGAESVEIGVGSFRDVLALLDPTAGAANFASTAALAQGRAHLVELGVNALELLPPADSWVNREWGYATSNYFAPDFDLGRPAGHDAPTAATDLAVLVSACHAGGMRFFVDMVMAFSTRGPYQNINFLDFYVQFGSGDPEQFASRPGGWTEPRDGFGGDLWKYNYWVSSYDPIAGGTAHLVPARQLMLAHMARWMHDFRVDGLRLDSVNNVANWDFLSSFTATARALWRERWHNAAGADERFLVVGEDLSVPLDLVHQRRLDGLWNERFKRNVRAAILGHSADGASSFEWTVRSLIDCRLFGFADGAQAVNYLTSHDVGGYGNERLYNFLQHNGVAEAEQRIKLAFVCLLTAVGIPMILAGDEFADQHDLNVEDSKQQDPVNYDRLEDPWRRRLCDYVARLVQLRTSAPALAVNDTSFLHTDFSDGKRVLVWQRGVEQVGVLIVVVANFSDWGTTNAGDVGAEYVVPGWPKLPPGSGWREVTQARDVPAEWAGREPIYPWEAKVYLQATSAHL